MMSLNLLVLVWCLIHAYSVDAQVFDKGICSQVNITNYAFTIELDKPIMFYRRKYSKLSIGARTYIAFVGERTYAGGFINRIFFNQYQQPLNVPNQPFLTASLSWGLSGEICYQQSNNLSLIGRYLELNDDHLKNNIGYYETDWTLLIFYWNNITVFRHFDLVHYVIGVEVAMLYDGAMTFSKFIYKHISHGVDYVAGFNSGNSHSTNDNRYFQIGGVYLGNPSRDQLINLTHIYRIDGDCVTALNGSCHYSSYATSCDRDTNSATECACLEGFTNLTDNKCSDINECLEDQCDQGCNDLPGSFSCYCHSGWKPHQNGRSCVDIDECATNSHHCHHQCLNNNGSYECLCNRGYYSVNKGFTCADINECAVSSCQEGEVCINTLGSFQCAPGCGPLKSWKNYDCVVSVNAIIGFTVGSSLLLTLGVVVIMVILHRVTKKINKEIGTMRDNNFPVTVFLERHDECENIYEMQ